MTIQPIGSASVALYITPADLEARGLTPSELTLEEALELTRSAFRQAGLALEGTVEIEAYPERRGVLVFAHVRAPERAWFSFRRLADLAAAARVLGPVPPQAALFWGEGRWWLALEGEEEGAAARLAEFGRAEGAVSHLESRLAEHGRAVWGRDALRQLLTYFPV